MSRVVWADKPIPGIELAGSRRAIRRGPNHVERGPTIAPAPRLQTNCKAASLRRPPMAYRVMRKLRLSCELKAGAEERI
jgi:hypothetical protein